MTEVEAILEAVKTVLLGRGIPAESAFSGNGMRRYPEGLVTVGLGGGKSLPAGFSEYLGERYDAENDKSIETFGKRLELEIALGIYSPKEDGAERCTRMCGELMGAFMNMPAGIRVREIHTGQLEFDKKSDMYLLPCTLKCVCFLYAERQEEDEILNFTLRGVPV